MDKAIFLDRDGVINRELGRHVSLLEEFDILESALDFAADAKQKGYKIIVITNQSGIALGLYDHEELGKMHKMMLESFRSRNAEIDAVYYCPHHPSTGKCLCRKPGSLMIEKALAMLNLDESKCFLIGDSERDVEAAESVGVKGYLVESNSTLEAYKSLL